jgi:hypothetical protein
VTLRNALSLPWLVLFALTGCGDDGSDVPHPVQSRADAECLKCHSRRDVAKVSDHNDKSDCVSCHEVKSTGTYPAVMPHTGGDVNQCKLCHQSDTAGVVVTGHIGEVDCYTCHTAPEYGTWPPATGHSVTATDDATCLSCHSDVSHKDRVGCATCHETQ